MIQSIPRTGHSRYAGTSLIEVLVAMLLLSFGMLSLAAMVSHAVQMPKLAGYRAAAVNLAAEHIARMRANPSGFKGGAYDRQSSYDNSRTVLTVEKSDKCDYPICDPSSLSTMDVAVARAAVRAQLPSGGMLMTRDNNTGTVSPSDGNLWIMWQEPDSHASVNAITSDNCPDDVRKTYVSTKLRCLYVRFKL